MRDRARLLFAGALLIGGVARGDIGGASGDGMVSVIARAADGCAGKGAVCARGGAASTVAVPATDGSKRAPAFKRTGTVAAHGAGAAGPAEGWTLELEAQLSRPALAGNAVFAFYDLADANAVSNHEVTAMAQAQVPAGKAVVVRARLSGEDGFHAGHSYRVQVAQILGGREVVLARGDFSLE